jgi:hypothetical protein
MLSRKTPLRRTPLKAKARKAKPAADREHMGRVAQLPCVVCRRLGYETYGVEVHHLRAGQGSKRASDKDTMPVCPPHHRGPLGIHGLGTKGFPKHYGFTELALLADTQEMLCDSARMLIE